MSIKQWPAGARYYVKLWEKKTNFEIAWHRESFFIGGLFSLGSLDMVEVICFLAFMGSLFFVGSLFLRGINCSSEVSSRKEDSMQGNQQTRPILAFTFCT